jgi:hypothetical protein
MKEIRRVGLALRLGALGALGALVATAATTACASGAGARSQQQQQPPAPSGPLASLAPILADDAGTPGTVEEECNQVVADLKRYSQCGLLDDDRKWWMGKWGEMVENDLALVKNPKLDAESKTQIAVSCRKAALVVGWAAAVCAEQAGQQPAQSQTLVKPSAPQSP